MKLRKACVEYVRRHIDFLLIRWHILDKLIKSPLFIGVDIFRIDIFSVVGVEMLKEKIVLNKAFYTGQSVLHCTK